MSSNSEFGSESGCGQGEGLQTRVSSPLPLDGIMIRLCVNVVCVPILLLGVCCTDINCLFVFFLQKHTYDAARLGGDDD